MAKSEIKGLDPSTIGSASSAVAGRKPKSKLPVTSIKRATRKKPKDKPKRPLSAYNYFFKDERARIIKLVLKDGTDAKNEEGALDFIPEETLKRLKKDGNKVSFEEMGKLIGQHWKTIDPERQNMYMEKAAEDAERYKKEMQTYNGRQEAKMRSEALKPPTPAWKPGPKAMEKDMDPNKHGMGGYGDMAVAAAAMQGYNQAAAMSGYSPYGMDMSAYMGQMNAMYAGYGGYGGMGAAAGNPALGGADLQSQYGRGAAAGMYGQMAMMGGAAGLQGGMMGYG